jgi:hypothetical protein
VSGIKDALDNARSEARELHKRIEANTAKDHAALRTDLQSVESEIQKLAASVKTLGEGQRADTEQHLKDAASRLEDAAKHVLDVAGASAVQLEQTNLALLTKVRDAIQSLSQAIASERSSKVKA